MFFVEEVERLDAVETVETRAEIWEEEVRVWITGHAGADV